METLCRYDEAECPYSASFFVQSPLMVVFVNCPPSGRVVMCESDLPPGNEPAYDVLSVVSEAVVSFDGVPATLIDRWFARSMDEFWDDRDALVGLDLDSFGDDADALGSVEVCGYRDTPCLDLDRPDGSRVFVFPSVQASVDPSCGGPFLCHPANWPPSGDRPAAMAKSAWTRGGHPRSHAIIA